MLTQDDIDGYFQAQQSENVVSNEKQYYQEQESQQNSIKVNLKLNNKQKQRRCDFLIDDEQQNKKGEQFYTQKPIIRHFNKVNNIGRRWTKEQDQRLLKYIQKYGTRWSLIGKLMKDKTGKSCRERWINNLDPRISWAKFNFYQQWLLYLAYIQHGPQWAQIAKLFPDRTDNQVKNHWNTRIMRQKTTFFRQKLKHIILKNRLKQIAKKAISDI